MENKKTGIRLIQKPEKGKMGALLIVFLWIAIWNVVYLLTHTFLEEHGLLIVNWAFFASVTLFFMHEKLTFKERFFHVLIGGCVGLLLAAGVSFIAAKLIGMGADYVTAVSLPLLVAIGVLILAHPFLPVVFNNVGFIYLIFSFVEADKIIPNLPASMLSLGLGSVILNLGCSLFIGLYTKALQKKASSEKSGAVSKN